MKHEPMRSYIRVFSHHHTLSPGSSRETLASEGELERADREVRELELRVVRRRQDAGNEQRERREVGLRDRRRPPKLVWQALLLKEAVHVGGLGDASNGVAHNREEECGLAERKDRLLRQVREAPVRCRACCEPKRADGTSCERGVETVSRRVLERGVDRLVEGVIVTEVQILAREGGWRRRSAGSDDGSVS
jgi:hypothetical protein